MSEDTHVGACTPLVIARTGTRSTGTSGQIGAHILRLTWPCMMLTALTARAVRRASAVMLNCGPLPLS